MKSTGIQPIILVLVIANISARPSNEDTIPNSVLKGVRSHKISDDLHHQFDALSAFLDNLKKHNNVDNRAGLVKRSYTCADIRKHIQECEKVINNANEILSKIKNIEDNYSEELPQSRKNELDEMILRFTNDQTEFIDRKKYFQRLSSEEHCA